MNKQSTIEFKCFSPLKSDVGARSIGIVDIALALNTTKTTVSYALNGKWRMSQETRAKILQIALQMKFQPDPIET